MPRRPRPRPDRRAAVACATLLGWLYRRGAVAAGLVVGAAAAVVAFLSGPDVDVLLALLRVAGGALRAEDPVAARDLLVYIKQRAGEEEAVAAAAVAGTLGGGGRPRRTARRRRRRQQWRQRRR